MKSGRLADLKSQKKKKIGNVGSRKQALEKEGIDVDIERLR